MALNLTTKYSPLIDERFKLASLTEAYAGKKYDFDGVRSIKVYSIDTVNLNDYNRSATGNRFGTPTELGDTVQTMTMSQDKSFTFTIDKGNASDQMNIKHCNAQLKSNWDEVCAPNIDMYRFRKWANGAGCGVAGPELTSDNAIRAIATAGAVMSNHLVPKKNRTLFIRESSFVECKLAKEIVGIDTLGAKAVARGSVGMLDGMNVVPVPDSYLPEGVHFMIKYKDATVDPMKLKTLRVHTNPPGIDGDLGECRYYHDSFVLGNKAHGIYVYGETANKSAEVVAAVSGSQLTLTSEGTVYYTDDGTNPKEAKAAGEAKTYSSAIAMTAGKTYKFYAEESGKLSSGIGVYKHEA